MGDEILRGVRQLSRRRLFGRMGQLGVALAGSLVATAALGPISAFASGCLDCIGVCSCASVTTCQGVDVFGGFVYCSCDPYEEGSCTRPKYVCATDTCYCVCCC